MTRKGSDFFSSMLILFFIFLVGVGILYFNLIFSFENVLIPFYSNYELIIGGILSGGLHAISGKI